MLMPFVYIVFALCFGVCCLAIGNPKTQRNPIRGPFVQILINHPVKTHIEKMIRHPMVRK